jgi:hypothetical protein
MVLGSRVDTGSKAEPTRLVFHRYGDRYFLNQIWLEGGKGYKVPESIQERELRKADSTPPFTSVTILADNASKTNRGTPATQGRADQRK